MSRRSTDGKSKSKLRRIVNRLTSFSPVDIFVYGGVLFIAFMALFDLDSLHFCGG